MSDAYLYGQAGGVGMDGDSEKFFSTTNVNAFEFVGVNGDQSNEYNALATGYQELYKSTPVESRLTVTTGVTGRNYAAGRLFKLTHPVTNELRFVLLYLNSDMLVRAKVYKYESDTLIDVTSNDTKNLNIIDGPFVVSKQEVFRAASRLDGFMLVTRHTTTDGVNPFYCEYFRLDFDTNTIIVDRENGTNKIVFSPSTAGSESSIVKFDICCLGNKGNDIYYMMVTGSGISVGDNVRTFKVSAGSLAITAIATVGGINMSATTYERLSIMGVMNEISETVTSPDSLKVIVSRSDYYILLQYDANGNNISTLKTLKRKRIESDSYTSYTESGYVIDTSRVLLFTKNTNKALGYSILKYTASSNTLEYAIVDSEKTNGSDFGILEQYSHVGFYESRYMHKGIKDEPCVTAFVDRDEMTAQKVTINVFDALHCTDFESGAGGTKYALTGTKYELDLSTYAMKSNIDLTNTLNDYAFYTGYAATNCCYKIDGDKYVLFSLNIKSSSIFLKTAILKKLSYAYPSHNTEVFSNFNLEAAIGSDVNGVDIYWFDYKLIKFDSATWLIFFLTMDNPSGLAGFSGYIHYSIGKMTSNGIDWSPPINTGCYSRNYTRKSGMFSDDDLVSFDVKKYHEYSSKFYIAYSDGNDAKKLNVTIGYWKDDAFFINANHCSFDTGMYQNKILTCPIRVKEYATTQNLSNYLTNDNVCIIIHPLLKDDSSEVLNITTVSFLNTTDESVQWNCSLTNHPTRDTSIFTKDSSVTDPLSLMYGDIEHCFPPVPYSTTYYMSYSRVFGWIYGEGIAAQSIAMLLSTAAGPVRGYTTATKKYLTALPFVSLPTNKFKMIKTEGIVDQNEHKFIMIGDYPSTDVKIRPMMGFSVKSAPSNEMTIVPSALNNYSFPDLIAKSYLYPIKVKRSDYDLAIVTVVVINSKSVVRLYFLKSSAIFGGTNILADKKSYLLDGTPIERPAILEFNDGKTLGVMIADSVDAELVGSRLVDVQRSFERSGMTSGAASARGLLDIVSPGVGDGGITVE